MTDGEVKRMDEKMPEEPLQRSNGEIQTINTESKRKIQDML